MDFEYILSRRFAEYWDCRQFVWCLIGVEYSGSAILGGMMNVSWSLFYRSWKNSDRVSPCMSMIFSNVFIVILAPVSILQYCTRLSSWSHAKFSWLVYPASMRNCLRPMSSSAITSSKWIVTISLLMPKWYVTYSSGIPDIWNDYNAAFYRCGSLTL